MTMKKIALLIGLLFATPAFAADNAVIVTPGVGVTMKSKDIGAGVQAMQPILSDSSGNALLTTLGADAVSNTLTGIPVYSRALFYNGTTWDRWQGAVTATLAAETTKVIGTVRVASGGVASGSFASGSIASGAVASGAVASGAYSSGSIASGAMVDLGSQADAACGTATGTCSLIALQKFNNTATGSAVPAGTNIIGKVGIDQTTPGTTNGVAIVGVNGATALAGNGVTGTGSPRVTIASDNSPVAGMGVGATGSAVPANAVYMGAQSGATGLTTGMIACDQSVVYDASTSGSTELVAISGSKVIYVCGYSIIAGGTVNVKLITGTGTACATGSSNKTPAYQLTAQAGIADGSPFFRGLKTAAGGALCINASAGIAAQAIVYYAQF